MQEKKLNNNTKTALTASGEKAGAGGEALALTDRPAGIDWKKFGKQIKKYRIKRDLRQKDLAELINATTNTISRIEVGAIGCSIDMLLIIADALEVSPDILLFGNFDPSYARFYDYFTEMKDVLSKQIQLNVDLVFKQMYRVDRDKNAYRYEYDKKLAETEKSKTADPVLRQRVRKNIPEDPNLKEEAPEKPAPPVQDAPPWYWQ